MFFGSQILILYAVEFFAALNNTCISDRTLLLLFLNCITTMHMNYSLFVLHLICHIRQNISLAVSQQQFPTKFCITTKHLDFSLFTFRFSLTHV